MINRNHGVILPKPKSSDFVAGGITGIEYKESNPSGQWDSYLPTFEKQAGKYMDAMACVSFSACNAIETLINFQTGVCPNFSDRFLAKMSGTTPQGNSAEVVADAVRHYGLVNEADWSYDLETFTWDKYYESIPSDIVKKGTDWLRTWEVMYEWLYLPFGENTGVPKETLMKHLKQAPIQILIKTCSPWNTDNTIAACPGTANHAVLLTGFVEGEYWKIFDTYNPFNKKLAWDYFIPWALKYSITKKTNPILAQYEGKYLMRTQGQGQIYAVKNGQLNFLSPNKGADGHTPLYDDWVRKLNSLGLLIGVTEEFYNSL